MFAKESDCRLSPSEIQQRALSTLHQMSLAEKTSMLSGNMDVFHNLLRYGRPYNPIPSATPGVPRLGVSPVKFTDGPRGIAIGKSTCFPVSMARGASFDRSLESRIGEAIAREARAQGANCFGGVCVNLLRHPAWGRAQETYGEDPFHVGEMGTSLMLAVQRHNVMACVKHFAVNNIENSRFFVNVSASDRVLNEVYLPHFRKLVQSGAASVMGAYNRFRGEQCCESHLLLTRILREDWGFQGFTMSDFIFGIHDGKKAIAAGLDLEMPIPLEYQRKLLAAVQSGELHEDLVNQAVLRILRPLLVFENTPDPASYDNSVVACESHRALAREAAEKSFVLLKNSGPVLPFSKNVRRVLVLGKLARRENIGDRGSSRVYPPYVVSPLQGLKNYLGSRVEILHFDETQLDAARKAAPSVDCVVIVVGCDFNDEGEFFAPADPGEPIRLIEAGYRNLGRPLKAFVARTLGKLVGKLTANKASTLPGGDRKNLSLKPEQLRLVREIAPLNPNTVVCLVGGSVILTEDWAASAPAILYYWYAGMEGGTALARTLFGDVNPSGKLPFSLPASPDDLPYFSSTDSEIAYDLFHGYTLLDKRARKPAFPFGFGLSYTTFSFRDLTVRQSAATLDVSLRVANTGSREGEEVVQVYVGCPNSPLERPQKLLRAFDKLSIPPSSTADVHLSIPLDDLRYFDEHTRSWRLEPGLYEISAGPSSDNSTLLKASIALGGA